MTTTMITNVLLAVIATVLLVLAITVGVYFSRRRVNRRATAPIPSTPRQYRAPTAAEVDELRDRLDDEPPVALSQGDRAIFRDWADTDADALREAREKSARDVDGTTEGEK